MNVNVINSIDEITIDTAPLTKGKLEFVVTASGTAIGISSVQVPQEEPRKYDAAHPIKNITTSINMVGTCGPIVFFTSKSF